MRHQPSFVVVAAFSAACFAASAADAQNISGVPSPVIPAGERAFEYRAAFGVRDDGSADIFAQRFQYQQTIAPDWRLRVLTVQEKRDGDSLKTTTLAAQVLHYFGQADGWKSGFRVDGDIALVDGRPHRLRGVWLNEIALAGPVTVRADLFVARQFGDRALDGVIVETREEFDYKLSPEATIGAQMFNNWGTTAGFGPWSGQRHQAGPMIRFGIAKQIRIEASILVGLSEAAPDADFRVFSGYSF